jgi:hypothetical protein
VSVEKLILARLAENSSRQDALQAIFSGWVDIFYHRIRGRFRRKRVFQQPRDNAPTEYGYERVLQQARGNTKMAANCDDTSADGTSSAPTHGSINSADSYFDMSTSSPPTAPSSTSPTSGSLCVGVYEIGFSTCH